MELTISDLQQVPDLAEVPEDQLQWLLDHGEIITYTVGEHIFQRGDPIDKMFVVLEGKLNLMVEQNGNYKLIGQIVRHDISGLLPYSRATTSIGVGEIVQDTTCLIIYKPQIREMTMQHYELTAALVHTMTDRTREFTRKNVQSEKMMALGKLSAGLAHELNNPAAAIARAARELKKHVDNTPETFKKATTMTISGEQIDALTHAVEELVKTDQNCHLSLLERTEKEDEMEAWLEENGVETAYELAPTLVEYCLAPEDLQPIADITGEENFPSTLEWLEHVLTTEKMVGDIQDSADRITNLVGSIKRYTHMDSAPEREKSDVRTGIKNTLTMLNHKLKKKDIRVVEDYANDLPQPEIIIGDINQVWTNLIDNAIDAMDQGGTLTLRGTQEKGCIFIDVIDNGSGIDEESLNTIFDPFYTTKSVGEGTGLGLDIVRRIVDQHGGSIQVTSRNGETNFSVRLPIESNE